MDLSNKPGRLSGPAKEDTLGERELPVPPAATLAPMATSAHPAYSSILGGFWSRASFWGLSWGSSGRGAGLRAGIGLGEEEGSCAAVSQKVGPRGPVAEANPTLLKCRPLPSLPFICSLNNILYVL